MAYVIHYWESGKDKDTHYELKATRLKSINEVYPLSLPHNRPMNCSLITVDRTDKQSNIEKIIWETK
jgi:hypothetical protein